MVERVGRIEMIEESIVGPFWRWRRVAVGFVGREDGKEAEYCQKSFKIYI